MNAMRRSDDAAAAAIATPAVTWSVAERSRAGVTTTIGRDGSRLPPMNQRGISTPQSIGATAVSGSFEPKLTPAAGSRAAPKDSRTRHASCVSDGRFSSMGGATPFNLPATRPATTTPSAFAMWTLCGVATMVTSGSAASNRRPSSSIPARVLNATSRSGGAHASAMAIPPCGAMAAKTKGISSGTLPRLRGSTARRAGTGRPGSRQAQRILITLMELHSEMRLTEYSHGAGCACKLSPVELGQILGALPPIIDPNVLHASASRDDAAVYRIAADRALVATVEFFTPIVDDPFEFGAIAAANALSDVYVVGAQPLFALGLTAFPRDKLGTGLLDRIVQGGASKLGEAGVTVVGGHSVDDPEPKFGYAVIREAHHEHVIGHEGASAGDVLFLTKPLCSGLVTTAVKRGLCPPALERQAVGVMMTLNREAAKAMLDAGATAATDVTGFGLIGHLVNLAGGADIDFSAVPF